MKTLFLLMTPLVAILLCSCESKAERTVKELKDLNEQYIKDIDNARTKEEAIEIRREYKERTRFEVNKLSDEEKEEYNNNLTWEEAKKLKQLDEETRNAENRARERFRNQ